MHAHNRHLPTDLFHSVDGGNGSSGLLLHQFQGMSLQTSTEDF